VRSPYRRQEELYRQACEAARRKEQTRPTVLEPYRAKGTASKLT
jgi:hypothetical protein